MKPLLVLGIGNILMGDEGAGILVIRHLAEKQLPVEVDILDGGTGGFHLLEYFQTYQEVVLVDATLDGKPPGTLEMIKPKFSCDYPPTLTAHDIGLKDLLDALYLTDYRPEITLFTLSITKLDKVTLEVSPQIRLAAEKAAKKIADYCRQRV